MKPSGNVAKTPAGNAGRRLAIWYGLLIFILLVFIARLFYLQIIKHDYYRKAALGDQLKQYSIAAQRGIIEAQDNGKAVPIVLNQQLYTLYADPTLVKHPSDDATKLVAITKGDGAKYAKLMATKGTRYTVLARRLTQDQSDKIMALQLPGVGTQGQDFRTYPQGTMAAQLLGFVNNDGQGAYGIEQYLNKQLSGTAGTLKAITDVRGVPLVASKDNIKVNPKNGDSVVLTIDVAMQKQLENLLKQGLDKAKSPSGSALIMNPNTGAVMAMANWPSYDPSQYFDVNDASLFTNAAVSAPLEVGSTMKVLTASAALDLGAIQPDTSYYDPSHWSLDGHEITNIEEDGGAGTHNIADILNLSINTGATWMLMQMGGQTGTVTQQARDKWHDYMVNHFGLGRATGIEQGYEASGYVPDPDRGYALQLTYADTSFGQSMAATPLQLGAAVSSVINGGTYYQPHLVAETVSSSGKVTKQNPTVVRRNVVSNKVSGEVQSLMEYVVKGHFEQGFSYLNFPDSYSVGGKTGTAQIADPAGGYYADRFNGTYVGFVGGNKPQYVVVVRVNQPGVGGYAGSMAAQPIFGSLAHMLINNFNVTPKSGQ